MRDHRKLKALELVDALALDVYQATRRFPRQEQFGLTNPMRRAAVSSAANIVEGCARHTKKDYVRFLDIAFASLRELGYYISLSTRLSHLGRDEFEALSPRHEEASRVLAGLIKSLR